MYYAFIKNNILDGCGQCKQLTEGVVNFEISDDIAERITDYIWDGENIVINPDLTKIKNEEQRKNRELAYIAEVDPITAHIQRLKDESPIPEGEIAELIAERDAKVQEIKKRYSYVDNNENKEYSDSVLTL